MVNSGVTGVSVHCHVFRAQEGCSMSRRLMPLAEIRTIVDDVDAGMEALCELLHKANSEVVCAQSVLTCCSAAAAEADGGRV